MSEILPRTAFTAALQTDFTVLDDPNAPFFLRLVQVNDGYASPGWETFVLLFHGPLAHFLPQATYRVGHDQLGEFDIFLVPVGKGKNEFHYEAVFNRLLPPS